MIVQELLDGLGVEKISVMLSLEQLTSLNELLFMHATGTHVPDIQDTPTGDDVTRALAQDALVTLQDIMEGLVHAATGAQGGVMGRSRRVRERVERAVKFL